MHSNSSSPVLRCTVTDCGRTVLARGMCSKHYQYWYYYNRDQARRCAKRRDLSLPDNQYELAYAAGLIDGEGTVRKRGGGDWIVRVSMTDREVIDWLSDMGGTVNKEHRPPRKPCYVWQLNAQAQVLAFLHGVLPYMKLYAKRDRARTAIKEIAAKR